MQHFVQNDNTNPSYHAF